MTRTWSLTVMVGTAMLASACSAADDAPMRPPNGLEQPEGSRHEPAVNVYVESPPPPPAPSFDGGNASSGTDEGADLSVDADAGADAGAVSDAAPPTPDAAPPPAWVFPLPASYESKGACWKDDFPNATCKPLPSTTPPIVAEDCIPSLYRVDVVRVPPRSCVRIQGRFDGSKLPTQGCPPGQSVPKPICKQRTNTSETEDMFLRVFYYEADGDNYRATWYALDKCPQPVDCL